ncbi:branched-chain amino acid ABC transporter substrate-binding protein [Streptomyces sp. NBC_01320]|uniref:branched-chain amino acid ABC transporter substrate-binding protein n=1 Tax=Streptomyces sp. NBC_01320 TaxID=2903824 RepID=UPI002E131CB1|nr:branched-chain amino acid ABC transporter substrate-binding protein [Streptomyces sp. NBC_01320]
MLHRKKYRKALAGSAALTVGLAVLGACGADAGTNDGSVRLRTVTIGVSAPLTGPLADPGKGIVNSVQLAAQQANEKQVVPGITFKIKALDDRAMADRGKVNARLFVRQPDVIGVVGPQSSRVALTMQQTMDQADLTLVSPANTNPALTLGPDWLSGRTARPYQSYFRTVTTDASQGPFAAQFVYRELGKQRVFMIDDDEPYGVGLAATFKAEFTRLGGTVAGKSSISVGDQEFTTLAARIANSGAEFVFCGGAYPECGRISRQVKAVSAAIPVVGGDAVYEPTYMDLAGDQAEGDVAISVGAPADMVHSARAFVTNYKIAGYSTPPGPYGGYAYDSAWAIVEAVKSVVADNGSTLPAHARAAVSAAMSEVTFAGMTGPVSFDQYGDATDKQLTVYVVRKGKWATLSTGIYVS